MKAGVRTGRESFLCSVSTVDDPCELTYLTPRYSPLKRHLSEDPSVLISGCIHCPHTRCWQTKRGV